MFYWYFKLFNNIKSESESFEFAKLELQGLFGEVKPIYNFIDKLKENPLNKFTNQKNRIQDFITYELPYGRIQGYFGISKDISILNKLVKRLSYIREIYLIGKKKELSLELVKKKFPESGFNRIYHFFEEKDFICFRFITYQYFLEKSEYISKLSRNEKEVDRNVKILFSHLIKNIYRIPASSTLSIGKRLEDYFAIREEPSLYLTHYFHPYKGKFHPKLARALLNYVYPQDDGLVMDNFAGSGTLLVEASLVELDSIGIEINPLSVLMANVKCNSLSIDINQLKLEIENYFDKVKEILKEYKYITSNQLTFLKKIDFNDIEKKAKNLSIQIKNNYLRNKDEIIPQILICKRLLNEVKDKNVKDFLLLALSGTISDVARRTKEEFQAVFQKRVNNLYLRLYLFQKLNEVFQLKLGKSKTYEEDARNMKGIKTESIDGIVNSPPYSVALDYIKNDYPQLFLLELINSLEDLRKNMIGNPRLNYGKMALFKKVDVASNPLPILANQLIKNLIDSGRRQEGLRTFKFFIDMYDALKEMFRVMKPGSKSAIVIGNNHFKVNDKYIEIPNDQIIQKLAEQIGFIVDYFINRELHKSSEGIIREESVVILKKEK